MQFFKKLFFVILSLAFISGASASEINTTIESRELGSCETNNLAYSAMKFYKIPLLEKFKEFDVFLRIILFFNPDGSLTLRTTTQALIACQTSTSGEVVCSFKALNDKWITSQYEINQTISIKELGNIEWRDQSNSNRGFVLTFAENTPYPHLRGAEFMGGMVSVNFNQNNVNTINICQK